MATYAIGDVQGCLEPLLRLVDAIDFDPTTDKLWFAGDLVNRGPDSLGVLRFVRNLADSAESVLGNHDFHALAIAFGGHDAKNSDTLSELFEADDAAELMHWLRSLPLMLEDEKAKYVLTHAGLPHIWSLDEARKLASEVAQVLRHGDYAALFEGLYGNFPDLWDATLRGVDRLRLIINYFTRMRLIDIDGRLDFDHKGDLSQLPDNHLPWFSYPSKRESRVLFGHWAALDGHTGLSDIIALDTGCVWGRSLTAFCLETREITRVVS